MLKYGQLLVLICIIHKPNSFGSHAQELLKSGSASSGLTKKLNYASSMTLAWSRCRMCYRVGVETFRRLDFCRYVSRVCDPGRALEPEKCSVSIERLTDCVRPIVGIITP